MEKLPNQTNKNTPSNRGEKQNNDVESQLRSLWLGRRDSNPRMPVPKTGALPLGDAPIFSQENVIYCTTNLLPSQQIEKASEIFHSEACVSLRHVLRLKHRLLVEPEDEANATNGSSR